MKPKKKRYLIGFSDDVKSKYMWQNSDNKCSTLTLEQYKQPSTTQARQAIKASNPSFQYKNLEVISITDMGLSRVGMPDKNIINTLNISNMKNELGFDELVDTAADVVELTVKVVDAVKDGIQLNDAFLLLAEAKNIEEIVRDAPKALAELKDLTPDEAELASGALADRLNADPGSVIDIVEQSINLLTRGYVFFADVILFAKQFKKETA